MNTCTNQKKISIIIKFLKSNGEKSAKEIAKGTGVWYLTPRNVAGICKQYPELITIRQLSDNSRVFSLKEGAAAA